MTTPEAGAPIVFERQKCWCERCNQAAIGPALFVERMTVCPSCGNKRCPQASWHGFVCTGSNEPGQVGTEPEAAKPAEGEADPKAPAGGGEERVTGEQAREALDFSGGMADSLPVLRRYIEQSEREASASLAKIADLSYQLGKAQGEAEGHRLVRVGLENEREPLRAELATAQSQLASWNRQNEALRAEVAELKTELELAKERATDEAIGNRDAQALALELKAERDELVRLLLQPSAADSTGEIGKWLRARRYGAPVPPLRPQQSPSSAKVELQAAPDVDHLQAARRAADLFHQTLGPTHAAKALGHLVSHAEQQRALTARTPAMMTAGVVIGPQRAPSQTSFTLTEDEAGPSSQRRYESDYEE